MLGRKSGEEKILFLCLDNSCSSQIAEAIARRLAPPHTRVFRAGITPQQVHPAVAKVMQEVQIDTSDQRPKGLEAIPIDDIDLVVAMGNVKEKCPALPPRAKFEHWSIPDSQQASGGEAAIHAALRYLRDEIDSHVAALFLDYWQKRTH